MAVFDLGEKKSHEIWELRSMQAATLPVKISLTKQRLREWVEHYGLDKVYISFSGGKDSTVLLHIAREMYPSIKAVFFDTGLEYPEIREFVRSYENVDWVRPDMNFRDVIAKYGYPFISKEVGECVFGARKYLTKLQEELASRQSVSQSVSPCRMNITSADLREQANIRSLNIRSRGVRLKLS